MCVLFYGGQLVQGLEAINPWKLPTSNVGSKMRRLDQFFYCPMLSQLPVDS